MREGLDKYEPERFLAYKQNCVLAMLECLESYDPYKGAEFLAYAHHVIGNALIPCRMMEEGGSFSALDEYKRVRGIVWLYNWNGTQAEAVQSAFEELAVMFEGGSTSGVESACRKGEETLTALLVEAGALHAVRLERKSVKRVKKKIAAAVYGYRADCDGEWGEIQFDFENDTTEIVRLAECDTMVSKVFAERVMKYIRACDADNLPKKALLAF